MTDDHHLDELASALLDGTASAAEAARAVGDTDLRARVEELRAVRAALRVLPPVDTTRREAAIGAALAAFAEKSAEATTANHMAAAPAARVTPLAIAAGRGRSARTLRVLGAAAALVLLAALVPLVARLSTTSDDDSASDTADTSLAERADGDAGGADPSAQSGPQAGSVTDEAASASPDEPVDLGSFVDVAALISAIEAIDLAEARNGVSEQSAGHEGDGGCLDVGADEAQAAGAATVEAATATVAGDAVVAIIATDDLGARTLRVLLSDSCALLAEQPL